MAVVLVVDDEDEIRDLVLLLLRHEGHDVRGAADGVEALDMLRDGLRPCVMLLDLMMPRLDGGGLLAAMCRDERLAKVPVVLVSGVADLEEAARLPGVVRAFTKPVDPDVLLDEVRARCLR